MRCQEAEHFRSKVGSLLKVMSDESDASRRLAEGYADLFCVGPAVSPAPKWIDGGIWRQAFISEEDCSACGAAPSPDTLGEKCQCGALSWHGLGTDVAHWQCQQARRRRQLVEASDDYTSSRPHSSASAAAELINLGTRCESAMHVRCQRHWPCIEEGCRFSLITYPRVQHVCAQTKCIVLEDPSAPIRPGTLRSVVLAGIAINPLTVVAERRWRIPGAPFVACCACTWAADSPAPSACLAQSKEVAAAKRRKRGATSKARSYVTTPSTTTKSRQ